MEVARITAKGQITIPPAIRKQMNLKDGDKVVFFEENGKIYLENPALRTFNKIQNDMCGEAVKAGFANEAELQAYAKEIRKELWSRDYADND